MQYLEILFDLHNFILFSEAPSAPPRAIGIIYVASRWFNASWESPLTPERNGVIIYYHISLRQNNSLNEPHVVFTTDSNPSISISSVLPYRVYFLTIAAFTIEQGPLSNPVVFQTLEDGKYSFKRVKILSIEIYMFPVSNSRGINRGYKILYFKTQKVYQFINNKNHYSCMSIIVEEVVASN